jgi:formylglycine-generating enzyme required for sulfatase activity
MEEKRVLRGGGWNHDIAELLSASLRGSEPPTNRINDTGFRCARTAQ